MRIRGEAAVPLFRRTPLPGKRWSKKAPSSSNDRSIKNPEFPQAENYADRLVDGKSYLKNSRQPRFDFLSNAGYY